jgi:hypothetical protein
MSMTVIVFLILVGLAVAAAKAMENPVTTGKLLWGLRGK